jgi:predicted Zn-dependent protease
VRTTFDRASFPRLFGIMTDDFEIEKGLTLGEWLHQELVDAVFIETDSWATTLVRRVADRLQYDRPISQQFEVIVPWITDPNAFTAPGRFIYFGRRLLERCPKDEMVAFVLGHEIAHHDLSHLALIPDWMPRYARGRGGLIAALVFEAVERRLYGPERECAADRYGLDLCIKAGYDPEVCLQFFHILEMLALDCGDVDMVVGPDPNSDQDLAKNAPWLIKARVWAWQRTRGYLPIQDRLGALRTYLEERKHVSEQTAPS